MSWIAWALNYAGLALLALAMAVHHRSVFGRTPERHAVVGYRSAGWALLAGGLAAALVALGWQIGFVAWFGMCGVGGFVLTLLLAFAPRLVLGPSAGLMIWALWAVFSS